MKPTSLRNFALVTLLAGAPALLSAQTTYGERHDINGRRANQQARIAQGARSGQLTPHETTHLERQEGAIHHEERAMRRTDSGHLTAGDRHVLAAQQNHTSREVFRDKHNLRTDPGVPPRF